MTVRGRIYAARMSKRAAGVIAGCLLAVTACSSHDATQQVRPAPKRAPATASSSLPPVTRPSTSSTLPKVPPIVAFAVKARNPTIAVYPAPNTSRPPQVLPNPWLADPSRPASLVPQVFLVQRDAFIPGWWHVLLPVRPNGSTGWVHSRDVSIQEINYRIRVELGARRITAFNGNNVVYQGPIAIGKASTPTPTGKYYVRVLIQAPNPNTVYGPYAYGLSSHSDVLSNFNGGDGEIGIHGNNDASVLGHDVTHGCIRMDNEAITRLAGMLPLGTPVEVVA
jgi:lipoprotein-anchoring transpeptidase ErfK/SrfK